MSGALQGLRIGLNGADRAVHVAGRCLADLGATVTALRELPHSDADRLWLGAPEVARPDERFDLLLTGTPLPEQAEAPCMVVYRPVSSAAAHAGQTLSEREICAVSGMAIAIGDPDSPALPMPEGSADAMIGTHLAGAALAALLSDVRQTEVAGADVLGWAVGTNRHLYLPYGLDWYRAGRRASGSGSCYPYALFEAEDGFFCMIGRTDRDWQALRTAMGDPDWAKAPRFADPRRLGRAYPEEADTHVRSWTRQRTRAQLMAVMVEHAFPGAPVLRPQEVLEQPALADRWRVVSHGGSKIKIPGTVSEHQTIGGAREINTLSRVRVLDLSWVWSGPAVSVALADLGADVIKVESATRPDNTRLRGRPGSGIRDQGAPAIELPPYFHALNRGKRSVSLDLRTKGGREVLFDLANQADVIIENLSAGVMDRFGIPPERVLESNPSCVFLSMRGYRDHQSTKGLRAYAPALSSSAGLEALVAYPGETPVGAMTVAFSDALATSQGILLALAGLYQRRAHGAGSAITLSQHEAAVLANGHNLVAEQLAQRTEMQPFVDDGELVGAADDLAESAWISPDLFGDIHPRYLEAVSVARLPWRQDGMLPELGAAAPSLGEHTEEILAEHAIDYDRRLTLTQEGALT